MMIASVEGAPASTVRPTDLIAPARWLLVRQLTITKWFNGIVALVIFVLALPLLARSGEELGFSLWENFSANGPAWFLFAFGAIYVGQYLSVLVALGVTRGRFAAAATLALAVGALILAVVVALGFFFEAWLHARWGWEHTLNQGHAFGSYTQVGTVIAEYTVRYVLFGVVGMLVGYGYYRLGGWWGTVALLFSLLVPLAFGIILLSQEPGGFNLEWQALGGATATGLWLTLLYSVILALAARALLTTVPLKSKVG